MSQQDDLRNDTSAAELIPPARVSRGPVSVGKCGLVLNDVRLQMLMVTRGDPGVDVPSKADVKYEGKLVEESLGPRGFQSVVRWSLVCDPAPNPVAISGWHELSFSLEKAISEEDARYYAEINAVVLVYPYLRQLIEDLTAKSLGRSIMLKTLDVSSFVSEQQARRREASEPQAQQAGAEPHGQEST